MTDINAYQCDICDDLGDKTEIKHLELYLNGSEGIMACLRCRISMTDIVRGMKYAASRAKHMQRKRFKGEL